ncbi:hypothetical protein ACSAZK_09250 [Methanosarcina sp. Mfa9]|uniref:hypothetical protein n=1 Tax=Methanosarcina sp. Mfa9 TaxID=3439063 RepID=UPI003F8531A3
MATITVPVPDDLYRRMEHFSWVKWSEVARNSLRKREIFEKYIRTGELSAEDAEFCDKMDWHPVDEIPLREDFVRKLEESKKETSLRVKDISDLFE